MRKALVLLGTALIAMLAMSSVAAASDTTCNGTLTGQTVSGDLVVPANGECTIVGTTVGDDVKVGENAYFQADNSQIGDDVKGKRSLTVFINTGTTVGGDVEAKDTFQVFVFNASVDGDVEVSRSTDKVQICGNTVNGDVEVKNSGRDILVGDPLAASCDGNTFNGDEVEVERNSVDVELVVRGNTFQGGDLEVNHNEGPADKFVQNNTGGDELECKGNEQPFTGSPNAFDDEEGQCEEPPVECKGTLTGQTIPGDLVVPDNGECTIVGTTVGDDVKVGENAYFQADNSQIGDDVKGKRSLTVFINTGTTVGGDVETKGTFQVFVFNATTGDIEASKSTDKVQVCGNQMDGDVEITDSGRDILVGDPLAAGCDGNTIKNGHDVKVEDNSVDVELVVRGNTFQGGDLEVSDNSGTADKFVQNNTGGHTLECSGNELPFTGTPNTFVEEQGQCAEI